MIGIDASEAVPISAKTGLNIEGVLEAIVKKLPPPKGDPRRAAEGAAGRFLVRRLSRRRRARARHRRRAEEGPDHQDDGHRRRLRPRPRRRVHAEDAAKWPQLGPGEVGFFTASIKEVADTRVGDTITDERKPTAAGAARLQARAAGGVLRPLPGRRRRVREPARRHGQAAPQRRQLLLRDGDLRRARLRLPLRLPRPAAPRDHPGAPGARVQSRPHLDRAVAWSTTSS